MLVKAPFHPGCEGQNPGELRVLSEPLGYMDPLPPSGVMGDYLRCLGRAQSYRT